MPQPLHIRLADAPHNLVATTLDDSLKSEYFPAPDLERPLETVWQLLYSEAGLEIWMASYHHHCRLVVELVITSTPPPSASAVAYPKAA